MKRYDIAFGVRCPVCGAEFRVTDRHRAGTGCLWCDHLGVCGPCQAEDASRVKEDRVRRPVMTTIV